MRNKRRKQVEHNKKKRQLVFLTVGILLFIYLTFNLISGENGLLKYLELRGKRDQLLAESRIYKKQVEDIQSEIDTMEKNPDQMEEHARKYGLTRDGELIFKFEDKK